MKKPAPFGKYYLLERINVGGMAEVFRAKAFGVEGFERLVAVKRILPNIAEDKEFIRMFIEEAKLAVQLNHANIAQIFDLGVVDGSYYIALEHVHGRDVRGIFDRCRHVGEAMPVAQACFVVMKVCEGLDYAHNKRDQSGRELSLVHRDVSPQNVIISFEGEVKLIDFGIAKAAGKGSKTQAGILKGKFGYMSPEQVRGLPIDRRSDVFSCGIVLYELLTGERLFVGESDFSTLEKVRNVEILPPSTYNRKIPDELERIVLKALAKDTEERYQNAIDLHDELQAFVYTAGEFYSRKDLAGWMKKTFGKEIEEETAKLESYRQLKPPPAEAPPAPISTPGRTLAGSRSSASNGSTPPPIRRSSTRGMGDGPSGTKPPPPPASRISQQLPAIPAAAAPPRRLDDSGGLAWDDDELETQIYDNPEDDPKNRAQTAPKLTPQGGPSPYGDSPPQDAAGNRSNRLGPGKNLPLVAAPTPNPDDNRNDSLRTTSRGMSATPDIPSLASANSATASPTMTGAGPDLSSLVSTTKGWESGQPNPASTLNGIGANGHTGSNKAVVPLPRDTRQPLFDSQRADRSAPFDPMASFGSGIARQGGNRGILLVALGGAVAAAIAVIAVLAMQGGDGKPATDQPAIATNPAPTSEPTPVVGGDQNTGFDLYVSPPGVTQWKLDGESRTDKLPSRIRGIAPGTHSVAIDPPPGFLSQSEQVKVELGKAPKVEITLSPVEGIHGVFESTPPGATVSLIIDGKREMLGPSPAKAPLDPRMTYQVLFEKPGYVSVNRPIVISGILEEKIAVSLEKAGSLTAEVPDLEPTPKPAGPVTKPEPRIAKPDPRPDPKPRVEKPDTKPEPKPDPKPDTQPVGNDTKVAAGSGTLMLGSKPSCDIYVDGSNTGLHTPQRAMKLSAGKHRITLINNEFGIKETFVVDIKADATEKAIKDYSERLPK